MKTPKAPAPPRPPKPSSIIKKVFNKHKKIGFYVLIAFLIFSSLSYIGGRLAQSIYVFFVFQLFMFGLGILHMSSLNRHFKWKGVKNIWKELGFTAVIILLALIAFLLLPKLEMFPNSPPSYAWTIFLIAVPLFFIKSFQFWLAIPYGIYKEWKYPYNKDIPVIERFELDARILILKKADDTEYFPIDISFPLDKTLGDVMHYLMYQFNHRKGRDGEDRFEDSIELAEDGMAEKMYGWVFSLMPNFFGYRRYLDPDKRISDLPIRKNATIIVNRVSDLEYNNRIDVVEKYQKPVEGTLS